MREILISLDFLSSPPKLKYSGHKSYQTYIGGIITLIASISFALGVFYFGRELFSKINPSIINTDYVKSKVGPLKINPDEISVIISLADKYYNSLYDNRAIRIRAFEHIYNVLNTSMSEIEEYFLPVEIDKCSNYFQESSQISNDTFIDLSYFLCLNPSQNLTLVNFWGSQFYSSMYLVIEKCVNSTDENFFQFNLNGLEQGNCYSNELISEKIDGSLLQIYITSQLIDNLNYLSPATKYLYEQIYSINSRLSQSILYKLKEITYINDSGFFLTDLNEKNFYQSEIPNTLYYDSGSRGNLLFDASIELSKIGSKIRRSYLKAQNFVTNLGGTMKAILILGRLFSQLFSRAQYTIDSFNYYSENYGNIFKSHFSIEPPIDQSSLQKPQLENNEIKNNYNFLTLNHSKMMPKLSRKNVKGDMNDEDLKHSTKKKDENRAIDSEVMNEDIRVSDTNKLEIEIESAKTQKILKRYNSSTCINSNRCKVNTANMNLETKNITNSNSPSILIPPTMFISHNLNIGIFNNLRDIFIYYLCYFTQTRPINSFRKKLNSYYDVILSIEYLLEKRIRKF